MIALFLVITLCLFCDMLSLLRDKEKDKNCQMYVRYFYIFRCCLAI